MSRRQALAQRLRVYGELRQIMGAMKNIALIELHKLSALLEAQRELLGVFENAAADFFAGHPALHPAATGAPHLVIAVGSERGFCGDFNEAVLDALVKMLAESKPPPVVILVGSRLVQRAEGHVSGTLRLEGPGMIEEVRPTMFRLLAQIAARGDIAAMFSIHNLSILHHREQAEGAPVRAYLPRQVLQQAARASGPKARLALPPELFLQQLIEQYLHAMLYSVFYDSLAAENHRRVAHMQAALDRIDQRLVAGRMRMNVLRQEEITEQIEEILVSAESLVPGLDTSR